MQVSVSGWLEAFAAHPRIGDIEGLRKKFGGFADMSKSEQAAASQAPESILQVSASVSNEVAAAKHIFGGRWKAYGVKGAKAALNITCQLSQFTRSV